MAEATQRLDIPDSPPASDHALGVTHSFSGRAWRFGPRDAEIARALNLSGMSVALSELLASRGVTRETVENFLDPRLKKHLPEPHRFAGMEKAAARFASAIAARETIAILGDYDVDGACASALLLRYLRKLGLDPLLYIPDRMTEGYGPSAPAMRSLREKGAALVVTVDCGAAAHEAMAAAKDCGLDAVVLDHHAVETHPPAFAHVNPNAPGDETGITYVCAAGLTFIFLVAVQRSLREQGWFASAGIAESDLLDQLDIVALATIADVVPLIGVNRAFVRQGLKKLDRLERPGLAALARFASATAPFSAYHLGFIFGPRINAGGRVGACDLGARLLASDDAAEADALAAELHQHNRERQAIEAQILEAANEMALTQSDSPFLLLAGDGWHPGVVGIVAGRLKERFGKPVFAAGFETEKPDAVARGSARSVRGVDLGAIVRAAFAEGLLETGGGHAMAAGFSLRRDRLAPFQDFLQHRIGPQTDTIIAASELTVDAMVSASGASLSLLADLDNAGPFGAGNPEPLFVLPDCLVAFADRVGTNHVRLRLSSRDGAMIGAIAFRAADTELGEGLLKSRGRRIHAVGRLKRDEYNGTARVQLHLEDAAPAGV